MIRPDDPVGGSRLPCRSLNPITRTLIGLALGGVGWCFPPASAVVTPRVPMRRAPRPTAATRRSKEGIDIDGPFGGDRRPADAFTVERLLRRPYGNCSCPVGNQ